MSHTVTIGPHQVGPGQTCFIVAEIGINHNGSLDTAKSLIDTAAEAGCHAVKFQKRTVDVVYTPEELAQPRETPFGTTNGELKRALEFGKEEYQEIDRYCKEKGILWFASCWDEAAVDFIEGFGPPCYKIASASLTDDNLLRHTRQYGHPIIMSTGMSTLEQIDHAVEVLGTEDLIMLHCNSTYPAPVEDLNLKTINTLQNRYDGIPIGYSGHETGLVTVAAVVTLGASVVERHITLDRAMFGSDQAASIEPGGFERLVRYVRATEAALGDGEKRVYDTEIPVMRKLRRVGL